MDTEKQISILVKQNEGIEKSLDAKSIQYNKLILDPLLSSEDTLVKLKDYNTYIKDISKSSRPPPQVKEAKPPKVETPVKKEKKEEDEDEDALTKEVKPVYSTITNMEDIKRAFFSKEYETAYELIKQHQFKFYKANYRYSSDNLGRPNYVAKNLLRGFVQGLDDYRKYLMVCFRCIIINKETNEYKYPSYWVINTNDDLKTMLGSLYDDYYFIEVTGEEDIKKLLKRMEKEDENNDVVVGEVYLH